MPQLNPEFFLSQLFWLIITFSFLFIFLWKFSLPRISKVLEKRESKINDDIESAKFYEDFPSQVKYQHLKNFELPLGLKGFFDYEEALSFSKNNNKPLLRVILGL